MLLESNKYGTMELNAAACHEFTGKRKKEKRESYMINLQLQENVKVRDTPW